MVALQKIEIAPYEVEQLLDVRLTGRLNEHGTLYVRALLSEEKGDGYMNSSGRGASVCLYAQNHEGVRQILFQGMVQKMQVRVIGQLYYLEVQAVSYSYLLDIEKRSRTFQDKTLSYDGLLQKITACYDDAGILDVVTKKAAIGQLLVQYEETDWQFLKRLASHFHTGLVNDVHFACPRCYFGVQGSRGVELEAVAYSVKKDMARYLRMSQNGVDGLHEQDFLSYEVETYAPVHVGEQVKFRGQTLYVSRVDAALEKGIFVYRLTLTTKNGMCRRYQQNDRLAGCSLRAKVTEIKNDRVKAVFELDEKAGHDPGELCFFPYATIYATQNGGGWYCMPEIGDSVRIYFPDGIEEHGYAVSSIYEEETPEAGGANEEDADGGYTPAWRDPSIKSLRNQEGKEIRLAPNGIYLIADQTKIALTDTDGIIISSDQNIRFESEKSITLSAGEDVSIMGLTGVDLCCSETSSIKMEESVKVVGQEIKSN